MDMTHNRSRIPGLDGLRAIAVVTVIASHQFGGSHSSRIYEKLGFLGVEIFFVLSGYLITLLLIREETSRGSIALGHFYVRRILRIFPPLLLYLGALLVADRLRIVDVPKIDFLACLLFFRNLIVGTWDTGHFWSLAIEEQFYVIWPIVLIFVKNKNARIICVLAVVVAAPFWRQVNFALRGGGMNSKQIDMLISPISCGCLLALLTASPRFSTGLTRPWICGRLPAILAMLVICLWNLTDLSEIRGVRSFDQTINCLAIAVIMNWTVQVPESQWTIALETAPFAWVGRLSYSLYLWQQPFMNYGRNSSPPWYQILPINLFFIVMLSVFSYYVVEMPVVSLRRKFKK